MFTLATIKEEERDGVCGCEVWQNSRILPNLSFAKNNSTISKNKKIANNDADTNSITANSRPQYYHQYQPHNNHQATIARTSTTNDSTTKCKNSNQQQLVAIPIGITTTQLIAVAAVIDNDVFDVTKCYDNQSDDVDKEDDREIEKRDRKSIACSSTLTL